MRALLYKQLRLVAHPMTVIFAFFGVMLLIPNYPYTVAFFYVTLGIFFMYMNVREQRDEDYSALLPIRKRDTVKAAMVFCTLIELLSLASAVPFAVLSNRINATGNLAGLRANAVLFAVSFALYAVFNLVFFPSFYKAGYKVGISFLKASTAVFFVVALDVVLPHLPGCVWLDEADFPRQWPLLVLGAVVYAVCTLLSYRLSASRYEKVDL